LSQPSALAKNGQNHNLSIAECPAIPVGIEFCTKSGPENFLGVPFNIASYALLTMMLAQQCDLELGEFIWTGGDCHIYNNHFEQVQTQLSRTPFAYPRMQIKRRPASLFDYAYEDFELVGYEHHPAIKAVVAV
jgi:thymidylate synthase